MKKRNLLAASVIGISAITMTACSNENKLEKMELDKWSAMVEDEINTKAQQDEVKAQQNEAYAEAQDKGAKQKEQFSKGFVDLYSAKTLQTTMTAKVNVAELMNQGMPQQEAEALKMVFDGMNMSVTFKKNGHYTEALSSMKIPVSSAGVVLDAQIPMLTDASTGKVYMGTDWLVDLYSSVAKSKLSAEQGHALREIDRVAKELKKGQFIDLNNIGQDSVLAGMNLQDMVDTNGLGFDKATEEIQALTEFLSSLEAFDFAENVDGSITLSIRNDQLGHFIELTKLLDLREELKRQPDISQHAKDMYVTAGYKDGNLDSLTVDVTGIVQGGITLPMTMNYTGIKMNTDVATYTPSTIDVLTKEETTVLSDYLLDLALITAN